MSKAEAWEDVVSTIKALVEKHGLVTVLAAVSNVCCISTKPRSWRRVAKAVVEAKDLAIKEGLS